MKFDDFSFIPFVSACYPSFDDTKAILLELEKLGADAIELGVPFSDPLADGPVIQEASKVALEKGVNLDKIFVFLKDLKLKTPIIIFSYYNPVLSYGVEAFFRRAKEVGVKGVILPDLPYEESEEAREFAAQYEIDYIMLVAPTSDDERIKKITEASTGFVYLVSSTGVTGVRDEFAKNMKRVAQKIRSHSPIPVMVGFGVSRKEHVEQLKKVGINGAIIGSAIIKIIKEFKNDRKTMLEKLGEFKQELFD